MKLALVRRRFSATGGAELYLQRLIAALAGAGHEIHLFAEDWEGAAPGAALHRLSVSAPRASRPVVFAEAARAAIERERFDCVFSLERTVRQDVYRAGDGVHRAWVARRKEFAPWWRKPFTGAGAFHRNMQALEARTFDPANTRHVIVNSQMAAREIEEHFQFPRERIHLIRNGIDAARFQRGNGAAARERFGIAKETPLLLFVGSGWERKGLPYLLEAMRFPALAHARLLVVGKGKKPLRAPSNVTFAGPMREVEDAYAAADLFVFPPIYEPCANVCFEALAAGAPVITTRQNGASELIREGVNGFVLDSPADVPAMAAAIERWLKRGRVRVAADFDLSLDRNVRETLAVLNLAARERA